MQDDMTQDEIDAILKGAMTNGNAQPDQEPVDSPVPQQTAEEAVQTVVPTTSAANEQPIQSSAPAAVEEVETVQEQICYSLALVRS